MNIDKEEKKVVKTQNFEDFDLFEEFEINKLHLTTSHDNELDFTRWQQDYEDEIDLEDFEQILINARSAAKA